MAEGIFIPDMVEEDDGGIAADHAPKLTLPVLAAPFPDSQKDHFNALRRSLVTVACKDVPGSHYLFDSSVLRPESHDGFSKVKGIIDRHPGAPLSIFGHADPEGDVVYNKVLSERRAEVVYAMLIRDVAVWERLFSHHEETPGDVWGDDAIDLMLDAVNPAPDDTSAEELADKIRRFQEKKGLAPSGKNDKALRAELFADYMDFLCSDDKNVPFKLVKRDFLGEGDRHGAFQGCSSFNLQLVLAKKEEDAFKADKEGGAKARHGANFDNRRAIIFFFKAGSVIDPKKWPCPRASDADKVSKCIAHFWSDGNDRRLTHIDERRRRFGKAVRNHTERIARIEQTFACRFYHGLAQHSPCERDLQMWVLQLMIDGSRQQGRDGGALKPLANVRYVLLANGEPEAPVLRGTTSKNGIIGIPLWVPIAFMRLRLDLASAMLGTLPPVDPNKKDDDGKTIPSIDIEAPTPPKDDELSDQFKGEKLFLEFPLFGGNLKRIVTKESLSKDKPNPLEPDAGEPDVEQDELDVGARQRLFNLGYGVANPQQWTPAQLTTFIKRFQKDKKLTVNGQLNKPTIDRLRSEYGS
jgi:hypothetical protein